MTKRYTMKDAIREVDDGRVVPDGVDAAKVDEESTLAEVLETRIHEVIHAFCAEHPETDISVIGTALLCVSAMQLMARLEMPPSDFATLARRVADLSQGDADAMRRAIAGRGQG